MCISIRRRQDTVTTSAKPGLTCAALRHQLIPIFRAKLNGNGGVIRLRNSGSGRRVPTEGTFVTGSIAILVLLVSAANAALPALFADPEARLPACCRRSGNHHCTMMPSSSASSGPSFAAAQTKCPLYPRASTFRYGEHAAPPPIASKGAQTKPLGTRKAQTQALYHISHCRARQKRAPPPIPVLS